MTPACVLLGGNQFLDCEAPLALGDRPMLSFALEGGALLVTLELASPPAEVPLHVRGNRSADAEVQVSVSTGQVVVVSVHGKTLLRARPGEPGVVDVEQLDLRPAGVGIFTAPDGLHLGSSVLADNSFVGGRFGVRLEPERSVAAADDARR
jgi:hypothetical protein